MNGPPASSEDLLERVARLEATCSDLRTLLNEREAFWQQAERRALALAAASQAFVEASPDFGRLVQLIAERAGQLLGTGCAVLLVAEDRRHLELAGIYEAAPDGAELMRQLLTANRPVVGEGFTGTVAATGRSMRLEGVSKQELLQRLPPQYHEYLVGLTTLSLLAVPIRTDDEVIGTLVLGRRSPAIAFDAADQSLAEDLAARFAVCLSRSRILHRLQTELVERQRAEQLLEETEDQLRQARRLEAIGLLAGGIAHDFNNLLTVILGTTDLLSSEVPTDHEWRPDLDAIATAGRSARDLTSQLLAFSRKQILQPTLLDANELVKQAELLLSRVIGENVTLHLDLEPALPAMKADRSQLEQSLLNLAANARDAMPRGGTITLRTCLVELKGNEEQLADASAGAYVSIAVSDTGQGIQDEARARLFEPFFTTKERGKGTGLGLAAVYGIVKQSAGHITVHSVVGRGTTFTIYLPAQTGMLAQSMAPQEPVPNSKAQPAQGQRRTILVVEDDAQVRAIVCRILGDHGYTVLTASTLDEASSLASRGTTIDLLISDMVLTQSTGVAVAELVRGIRPELKVLFMTGYADSGQAPAVGERLQGMLHKPFTPAALLDRVHQVLAGPPAQPA